MERYNKQNVESGIGNDIRENEKESWNNKIAIPCESSPDWDVNCDVWMSGKITDDIWKKWEATETTEWVNSKQQWGALFGRCVLKSS
jgi:hypothetical protein